MRKVLIVACFIISTYTLFAQEKYSKLKIHLESKQMSDLISLGLEFDHGNYEEGKYFTSDFSASDRLILDRAAIPYEVLIDDIVADLIEKNALSTTDENPQPKALNCFGGTTSLPTLPAHWHLGSMGGYFTYAELLQILDSMALEYPSLISVKRPISDSLLTFEGRPVYIVKISDHPDSNETAEPKVLYTALHHAREPLSLSQLVMYMYYVLENYNTDATIKNIVDNTEMYFVPCLNPDGYLYNQTTNPGGGGMWRKNRKNNGDGTFGVDLNRNYGFYWGYDNVGSSPTSSNETYRGTIAFSEPETKMIRDFTSQVPIEITLNYHTYGNDIIYPWGHVPYLTPDSSVFKRFAAYLIAENKYKAGTGFETVGYNVNGDSDDFGYGDSIAKHQYYSMTPECGDAFWMPSSQITATCQNLLWQNIKLPLLVLDVADVTDKNKTLFTQTSGQLKFEIERIGLLNTDTFQVRCVSLSPGLTVSSSPIDFVNMDLLERRTDSVSYTINPSLLSASTFSYIWELNMNGVLMYDTIYKYFEDSLSTIYSTDATSISGWTNSGTRNWGLSTTQFVSASTSIHDSPTGNYANNTSYILTNNIIFDLTYASKAYLHYYCKWNTEDNYDYAQVLAVDVNTSVATPLCGRYTVEGSVNEDPNKPVYDGVQNEWVQESIDLSDFLGKQIKIQLKLITDPGTVADGFYFDDMEISAKLDSVIAGIHAYQTETFNVYPTLTSDEITIINTSHEIIHGYEIIDQMGNIMVQNHHCSSDKELIHLRNYSSGLYYLKVLDSTNQAHIYKLMKY